MLSAAKRIEEKSEEPLVKYLKTIIGVFGGININPTNIPGEDSETITVKFKCNAQRHLKKIANALDTECEKDDSNYTVTISRLKLISQIEEKLNTPVIYAAMEAAAKANQDPTALVNPKIYMINNDGHIFSRAAFTNEHTEMGLEQDKEDSYQDYNAFKIIDMMKFVATLHNLRLAALQSTKMSAAASQAIMIAKFKVLSEQLATEAKSCSCCRKKEKLAKKTYIDTILADPAPTLAEKIASVNGKNEPQNLLFVMKGKRSHRVKDHIEEALRLRP